MTARETARTGQRVLVAGATGGIGEGACRALLRAGAEVVAVGRSDERLRDLARRLPAHAPGQFDTVVADVTAAPGAAWFASRAGTFDGVLVAIGDPGRPHPGTVLDIPDEDVRRMVEVNELGGLRALRTLVPLVRPSGAVVTVLGMSAEVPFPQNPLMGSTNAAMRSLLSTLAVQLRPTGPRIYGLILGMVRTRARQAAGIDHPGWLTGDEIGDYAGDLIGGRIPAPEQTLRYLVDPRIGPSLTPPG